MKAFEIVLLKNQQQYAKNHESIFRFYGCKKREEILENLKFYFCHRITKLIKKRRLHDIMI